MVKRMRRVIIRQKRPYGQGEVQGGLGEGLLVERWVPGITDDPAAKHGPVPAPDPAMPTVVGPAPVNLAAESMSRKTMLVWKPSLATWCWGALLEGGLAGS